MTKKYTYEEVFEASLEYFKGDDMAAKVFTDKYALTDGDDFYELTPCDMHKRLASEFARIESKYENPLGEEEIFNLLDNFNWIIPQGSPMSVIGNPYQIMSAGNCFVVAPPEDSYAGIMFSDQQLAQLMKRRCGVGVDISKLRPKGMPTKNAAKTTDGIGVFMERFSNTCREVAQNGRRGAELMSISVHHPEVETFINIKRDLTKVTGANISIRFTDEFMEAVEKNEEYEQRWPVDSDHPIVSKMVKARDIWDQFVDSAWASAEPGALFWDTILRETPSDIYSDFGFASSSTNPCGEIVLSPNDSCRLLVVNLYSFVKNKFTSQAEFDFELFANVVQKAQRLMDDIIDIELECVDKILAKIESDPEPNYIKDVEKNLWLDVRKVCEAGRRTGTGITALGDTLAALNIVYGSNESVEMTEKIYKHLAINAHKSSCILAKERGTFPIFNKTLEKDHPYLSRIYNSDPELKSLYEQYGRRNIALTTTAPTGSVSIVAQTSSGIEPVFALSYMRRKKINPADKNAKVDFVDDVGDSWQHFNVYHHAFKDWMDATGKEDVKESPYYGGLANDVDWENGVKIQSAAQRWLSHSISRTANLPKDTPKELVDLVYRTAWKEGCKGFTIYRDGSRSGVLVTNEEKDDLYDEDGRPKKVVETKAPRRPKELPCEIHQPTVKGKKWTVLVGLMEGQPYEIFMGYAENISIPSKCTEGKLVKAAKGTYNLHVDWNGEDLIIKHVIKTFDNPESAWATRMVSTSLRHGVPVDFICEQLSKDGNVTDINKVLSRILKKYVPDGDVRSSQSCPQCGSTDLVYQEGCLSCNNCGYTKCN